jgi:peptidyl-prolyl cis-trans isomerase D
MFIHIRKHQKWLWLLISASVIISFVWYFNPNQRYNRDRASGRGTVGLIYGEPISMDEYNHARAEAELQHLFTHGTWYENSEANRQLGIDINRETKQRLFLIHKIRDYDIRVSDTAVADWITQTFADRETKVFRKESYDGFIKNIRTKGLEPKDFERYVRTQVGIQHLASAASLPGKFVTPQEVEKSLREEKQKADTIVAFLHLTNFLAKVQVNDTNLVEFYTRNSANYRLPERVQLSYVSFPISNYTAIAEGQLGKITNLNQQIDMMYAQRGANFFTDTNNQVMTPEAAKAKIREEVVHENATVEARKAANALAEALLEKKADTNSPNPAENLEQLAAVLKLEPKVTQPFGRFESPAELNIATRLGEIAFQLTPEEPSIPEPVVGEDAVYVMALKRKVATELPELATIKDRVTEDYKRSEAGKMLREAGAAFANNPAAKTNFAQAAVDAGLTIMNLPPLPKTGAMIPELENRPEAGSIRNTAFTLKEGETSSFMPARDVGFVVHMEKLVPVSEEEMKSEMKNYAEELRRRRASDAFQEWFSKEYQMAKLTLAGDREEREESPQ